jgi:hypothetical protein
MEGPSLASAPFIARCLAVDGPGLLLICGRRRGEGKIYVPVLTPLDKPQVVDYYPMYELAVAPASRQTTSRRGHYYDYPSSIGANSKLEPGDDHGMVAGWDYPDFRFQTGGETEIMRSESKAGKTEPQIVRTKAKHIGPRSNRSSAVR